MGWLRTKDTKKMQQNTLIWLFTLACLILVANFSHCCQEVIFLKSEGVYFANRVAQIKDAASEINCCIYCMKDDSCLSVNYQTSGRNRGLCQLNAEKLKDFPQDRIRNPDFCYFEKIKGAKVTVKINYKVTQFYKALLFG